MQSRTRTRIVRTLFIFGIVSTLGTAWLNRAVILRGAAEIWVISDAIENADAVAVLGGGVNTRPFAAADLYNAGKVKLVLVAAVKPSRIEDLRLMPSNSELARSVLIKLGVAPQAIIAVGHDVSNTYEEARAVREWARNNGATKIIIVTEMFSSRRVRWIFDREFAMIGVKAIIYTVADPDYDFYRWWQDERGIIQFQNEALKYLYYRLRY
jgi:uncharacterized SAM-binding protein YcdF (DUF218 family)